MPMFFKFDEDKKQEIAVIPLLPLRDVVIFPHMVAPLFVGREKSIRALEEAMKKDKEILLSAQKDAKDRKSTRLNSSHSRASRMPSSA